MTTENNPPEHYVYKEGCDCLRCQLQKAFNELPLHSPVPVKEGEWSYDYKFLKDLTYRINKTEHGDGLSMEEVEAVLLSINYPQSDIKVKEGEQENAVKFAEWIEDNRWWFDDEKKLWSKTASYEQISTEQLYKRFKQSTTKPLK